jgi:hypothetical protein
MKKKMKMMKKGKDCPMCGARMTGGMCPECGREGIGKDVAIEMHSKKKKASKKEEMAEGEY